MKQRPSGSGAQALNHNAVLQTDGSAKPSYTHTHAHAHTLQTALLPHRLCTGRLRGPHQPNRITVFLIEFS